jgi:hypothetical protein
MAHAIASKLDRDQARIIRAAQASGRALRAWSASVAGPAGEPHAIILYAVTDRAAASLASAAGPVLRVGPANVRDLAGALDRALALVPPLAPRDASAPPASAPVLLSDRARALEYLAGFGERPADVAVSAVLGPVVRRLAKGEPHRALTVNAPRLVGAPIAGEYSLSGGRRAA